MEKFKDRKEAGKLLGESLARKYPKIKNGIILALPRGGVVVAAEISKILNLPLDIIVTRKIGAPQNPEYAVAALSEHEIIQSDIENIDPDYLKNQTLKERQEIQRRLREYRGDIENPNLKDKFVIIVDDGLATGLSMQAAILEIKRQYPASIIIAVPVAPPETLKKISPSVDDIMALICEPLFFAVGQFYVNFEAVQDSEVKKLLRQKD